MLLIYISVSYIISVITLQHEEPELLSTVQQTYKNFEHFIFWNKM